MAELREVLILAALFGAFWITVHHPFFVASAIIALILYSLYNSPSAQQKILEIASKTFDKTLITKKSSSTLQNDTMTRTGIERARKQYIEHCNGGGSVENDLMTVSTTTNEDDKWSKLLLTYQVPILTSYYESIIKFFTN